MPAARPPPVRPRGGGLPPSAAHADGRPFLFGDAPGELDLTCFHTLFLLRRNCPPEIDEMAGRSPLLAWYERVAATGRGRPEPLGPEEAFDMARDAEPAPAEHFARDGNPAGLRAGTRVTVAPDDNARPDCRYPRRGQRR